MQERAEGRVPRIAGWTAFAAACLLVTGGVLLPGGVRSPFGEDAVLAIGFTGLGALVLSRQPGNRAGWLCLTPLLAAVAYAADAYARFGPGAGLPGGALAGWLARWIWLPGVLPVLTLLLLFLPDGRLPGPRWRPVVWLVGSVIAVCSLLLALVPVEPEVGPQGPVVVPALAPLAAAPDALLVVPVLGCAVLGLAALGTRLVRSRATERAQLLWITTGAAVFVIGSTLNAALPPPWPSAVAQAAALTLPVGFGIAMLRHRLLDLNPVLRRLVLALILSVLLLVSFAALRAILGEGPIAAAAVTLGLALATPSLTRWLGGGVDRIVYGRRGAPGVTISGLGRRLQSTAEPDDVLLALVDVTGDALPVSAVRAVLTSGDQELRRVERGDPDRLPTQTRVLRFGGSDLGRLEVSARKALDEADRALLDDLAASAAAAVAAAHRALELQRSREELVLAREQERRRIARDLHDGGCPGTRGT